MSSKLQTDREKLAQILGQDVRLVAPKWLSLMRQGVLIELHIRRWRAKSRLTLEDLGLPATDSNDYADLIKLGEKSLFPPKYIKAADSIEASARQWLETNSTETFWGRFMPCTMYEEWKTKQEEYRSKYFALRDEIDRDYDQIVRAHLLDCAKMAKAAYRHTMALDGRTLRKSNITEEQYARTYVSAIAALIPARERIYEAWSFDVSLSYVPLPSLLADDQAEAERINAQRKLEKAQEQAEQDKVWLELSATEAASRKRQQMLEAMNRDVVEAARKQKEQLVDGFIGGLVKQIRGLVYEAATDVLQSIQKNDRLHPRSVVQLRGLIDQVGQLNFYNDGEIGRMITQVQQALDKAPADRDVREIETSLRDIATVTRSTLVGLGEQPRGARSLGVADAPSVPAIRAARARLGIDTELRHAGHTILLRPSVPVTDSFEME
jgi:hypothetical protein